MKKKIVVLSSLIALTALLTVGAAAADGGIVKVKTTLNVRSAPNVAASIRTSLYNGQVITLISQSGDWWYIEYGDNKYGYVNAAYVNALGLSSATVHTAGSNLNVRSGAGTAYSVIGKLKNGESVLCLDKVGSFTKILYNGNSVGYVASSYLAPANSQSQATISLNVPSYKQYDSRWSNLKLPGSGEKLSTHGCAVTSLAMTESYRTGKSVTPANVLESEKFTSSGAIYWPQKYSRGETTLASIYSSLAAGKPVILHVKKSNGATHFVVVYGCTGNSTDSASFTIRDPGSYSRTNLSQLLSEYPTIIKAISY